ncbi:hypothetical protein DPMN_137752 [Dreissena polymorpha]|uniref:Uncharacterized protein n=1 Tax=Dreissena polymorpha TaxID=45954 RepID=A0A9D4JGP0_DREPO|nr:hypothetical protein DPMN_137752 [Dreissena polymorpha]
MNTLETTINTTASPYTWCGKFKTTPEKRGEKEWNGCEETPAQQKIVTNTGGWECEIYIKVIILIE